MVKLSGGEALARSLVTEGVEVVFGIRASRRTGSSRACATSRGFA